MAMRETASCLTAIVILVLFGCSKPPVQQPARDSTTPGTPASIPANPTPTNPSAHELVRPAALPAATCDSASTLLRQALALEVKRENGDYFDLGRPPPIASVR
jgi:hypothetical protein